MTLAQHRSQDLVIKRGSRLQAEWARLQTKRFSKLKPIKQDCAAQMKTSGLSINHQPLPVLSSINQDIWIVKNILWFSWTICRTEEIPMIKTLSNGSPANGAVISFQFDCCILSSKRIRSISWVANWNRKTFVFCLQGIRLVLGVWQPKPKS